MTTGLQDNGSVKRTWTPAARRRRPIRTLDADWNASGGGDGHWNVIDPTDTPTTTRARSPRRRGTHSCAGRHDTATATQTLTVANTVWPADQRCTTDAPIVVDPNVPPSRRRHAAAERSIIGGTMHRALAQPRRRVHDDLPAADARTTPDPGPACPARSEQRARHRSLRATSTARSRRSRRPSRRRRSRTRRRIYAGTDTGRCGRRPTPARTGRSCRACRSAG